MTSRRSPDGPEVTGDVANRLWSERAAARLGFDRLGAALGRPGLAPYLLLAAVYALDVPVLSTVRYLQTGYHPYLVNPAAVMVPILAAYAIWSSRRLRDRFEAVIDDLLPDEAPLPTVSRELPRRPWFDRAIRRLGTPDGVDEREQLATLIAPSLKRLLLVVAWGLYVAWILRSPTVQQLILESEGPVIGGIKYGLLLPFVYLPLAVEFVTTYLGTIVILPVQIRAIGLIDFQDPLGFGGLRPVGDLVRRATTHYLLGLGGYVAGIGIGHLLGRAGYVPQTGLLTTAFIGAATVLGVALFVFPVVVLHGHMKAAKHDRIHAIATEVERRGPEEDSNMFPDTSLPDSPADGSEYLHLYVKLRKVENTREFPIDVSHLQELVLAALVPYLAHVTVTFLLSYTGGGH